MNDNRLSEDLADLADEFRSHPLAADVTNRDQLMFECGRAAAASRPKRQKWQSAWVRQALLVACSVCVGAMATHWIVPAEVVVVQTPSESPAADRPAPAIAKVESHLAGCFSEQELAAVRSGQLLCVSSDLSALDSFNTLARPNSPLSDGPSMRAGMRHQLSDFP